MGFLFNRKTTTNQQLAGAPVPPAGQVPENCNANNPQALNIGSQMRVPFTSGDATYFNLEEWAVSLLTNMVISRGVSYSHKDKEHNKTLKQWIERMGGNTFFIKVFRLTALYGDRVIICLKNSLGNPELFVNEIFNMDGYEITGYTPTAFKGQFNLSDNNSPDHMVNVVITKNKIELSFFNIKDKEEFKIAKGLKDTTFQQDFPILPVFLFNFYPHKNFVSGTFLTKHKFNFGCENLQVIYNKNFDWILNELNTNFTRSILEGTNPSEIIRGYQYQSKPLRQKHTQQRSGNYTVGEEPIETLVPSQPSFESYITLQEQIKKEYAKGCHIPYFAEDFGNRSPENATNLSTSDSLKYIELLRVIWDKQFKNMFVWLCKLMGIPYEDEEGNSLIECYINQSMLNETKRPAEEVVFEVRNGLMSPVDAIMERYALTRSEAEQKLDQIKEDNTKYKELIFQEEKIASELAPKNPDGEGHSEDIADKKTAKKPTKDKE